MLFLDENNTLCAYIKGMGFKTIAEEHPYQKPKGYLEPLEDGVLSYTDPWGNLLLWHPQMVTNLIYNTVKQQLTSIDAYNMFSVDNCSENPYTALHKGKVLLAVLMEKNKKAHSAESRGPCIVTEDDGCITVVGCDPYSFQMMKPAFVRRYTLSEVRAWA